MMTDEQPKGKKKATPASKRGNSATLHVSGSDVVITDPCYLIKDELWSSLCSTEFLQTRVSPRVLRVGTVDILLADTIYGDWMCRLEGVEDGEPKTFGTFTADAGMVCATTFGPKDEAWEAFSHLPQRCWCVIPDFMGSVTITHRSGECTVSGEGTSAGKPVKFNNVQIG